jgi:hypothetical protein
MSWRGWWLGFSLEMGWLYIRTSPFQIRSDGRSQTRMMRMR